MLFISDITWTVLKMVVDLQGRTVVYRYIQVYGDGEFLKRILTYLCCSKCNETNICHSDAQKHVTYTGSHERFVLYYGLRWE